MPQECWKGKRSHSRLQNCLLAKVVRKAALPDSRRHQQAGLFQEWAVTGRAFSGCLPHQRTAITAVLWPEAEETLAQIQKQIWPGPGKRLIDK